MSVLLAGCSALFPFEPDPGSGGGDGGLPGPGDGDGVDGGQPDGGSCGQVLSTYPTRGAAVASAVVGNAVLVTWQGGGVDLIDVGDPRHPERLDSLAVDGPVGGIAVSTCPLCSERDEGRATVRAFVANAGGVEALRDGILLATLGRLRTDQGAVGVAADAGGGIVLVGLADRRVVLLDVDDLGTEPDRTRLLSETGPALELPCAARSVALLDSHHGAALVGSAGGCTPQLWLFDVGHADPSRIVDLEDEPSQIVVLDDETLLLVGGSRGLWRVSLASAQPVPQVIPVTPPVRSVAIVGTTALAIVAGGLRVLDLSSASGAEVVAEVDLPGDPRAVTALEDRALVAAGDVGLLLVDVGCWTAPRSLDDGRDPEPVR